MQHRVARLESRDHLLGLLSVLVEAHREQLETGVLIARVHFTKLLELRAAVAAPSSPKRQHDDLAAKLGQPQVLPGQAPQREIGRLGAFQFRGRRHGGRNGKQRDEREAAPNCCMQWCHLRSPSLPARKHSARPSPAAAYRPRQWRHNFRAAQPPYLLAPPWVYEPGLNSSGVWPDTRTGARSVPRA